MTDNTKQNIILAASMAATYQPDSLSNDKLEAATKGHGSLVLPVYAAANSIAEDVFCSISGKKTSCAEKMTILDAALGELPLDTVIEKAVKAAMSSGAAPENAALIVAALAYFAGSAARSGVPLGNRKLGAMARMHAGGARTSAIALVTGKSTHRIQAFPAYMAIYKALEEKKLTKVDGSTLPGFISGGTIYGHSALGEDYNIPELAYNGAQVGTKAMLNAMAGAGVTPLGLWPALIGATVIMEIVHPDAILGEEFGKFGAVNSSYMAGKGARDAANLPEKLHIRGTREEYDTATLLGDFALILKDVGGPSVIGSMAFSEIFAGFEEAPMIGAGFSGGPVNAPLGHVLGDIVPALRLLLQNGGDVFAAAEVIREYKMNSFIDPELAICSLNTIARKAEQVSRGKITNVCILASEGVRDRAVCRRADLTYEMMKNGKTVADAAKLLDEERRAYVEKRGSAILSGFTGHEIDLKFTELRSHGRRTDKFTERYWGFDSYVSYDVNIDGRPYHVENLSGKEVPAFALEGKNKDDPNWGIALQCGAIIAQELQYIGHTIINITVPAAVAALFDMDAKTAAKEAENGAYLTRSIPGANEKAAEVAKLAQSIYAEMKKPFPE
ncbi:MAG: hypothetical protein WC161_02470 [Methanocorpusculum sp.]|jgi:methylthioribose-1-phosphate isomerase|uniref:hypothetical protein n=1 Tax=Methanocorpusculum sp. GPch4 TaxID=2527877 RepID=UPI001432FE2F|nr:hypothetical protein [Methanocorpusculum sp. GPch4]MDD4423604.1 hypothetical protein [Methanocorpusculum parvum]MDY3202025.1 hypothetical protein [Methanocorpusculum sp.]NLC91142.1 hypothetical protein [Methanocorpusculum parvum]HJJ38252.1 hypothetical protein [Methanocorpusculum sp.]